MTRSTL